MALVEERVRRDFAPLAERILGVYLFGSHAEGTAHEGSDVDVCVVAGPDVSSEAALADVWRHVPPGDPAYDIKVFEELPLFLKGRVLDHGVLVLSRDAPALSEYVRPTQKIWADERARNTLTREDVRRMLAARRSESEA